MFTAALFTIGKNWKYASTVKWKTELNYIYIMEYYTAVKINHNINDKSHIYNIEKRSLTEVNTHSMRLFITKKNHKSNL